MELGVLLMILAVWVGLAYIPARIADSKGRSFVGFLIGGLFCFFPALIVAMSMKKPEIRAGDIVRLSTSVQLDDGTSLPQGLAAKVLDVDVIDGEPVALVRGPSGSSHWISMTAAGGGRSKRIPRPVGGTNGLIPVAPEGPVENPPVRMVQDRSPMIDAPRALLDDTRQAPRPVPTRLPVPGPAPGLPRREHIAAWHDDPFGASAPARMRYEVARVDSRSLERRALSPALGITYDLSSWFPVPRSGEAPRAAFVLSVVLLDGSEQPTDFAVRGKSTLLLTSQRMVGVCPQGDSASGPFRAETGNVAVWTMSLEDMDQVTVARSAASEHAIVRSRQTRLPWLLLAKPRIVVDGALQPVEIHRMVDLVNDAVGRCTDERNGRATQPSPRT